MERLYPAEPGVNGDEVSRWSHDHALTPGRRGDATAEFNGEMRDDVRQVLAVEPGTPNEARTIDITTTGRRSGEGRRIEIVFYRFEGDVYLSGIPSARRRDWLINLEAHPEFTFHLKHGVVADLPAVATVITDPAERRRVMSRFVQEFNERNPPGSSWPRADLDEWVAASPLARVEFPETD